jgi:hypothetical protein
MKATTPAAHNWNVRIEGASWRSGPMPDWMWHLSCTRKENAKLHARDSAEIHNRTRLPRLHHKNRRAKFAFAPTKTQIQRCSNTPSCVKIHDGELEPHCHKQMSSRGNTAPIAQSQAHPNLLSTIAQSQALWHEKHRRATFFSVCSCTLQTIEAACRPKRASEDVELRTLPSGCNKAEVAGMRLGKGASGGIRDRL